MHILLVEPNYKNKYPPMGLMKISRYHKDKGDYVYFYKGLYNNSRIWDRIYITTLFTFDYKMIIDTINFYKKHVMSPDHIIVGGIAASIMTERLQQDTALNNILPGRLTDSTILGYDDHINIDSLPLDYDILRDTEYVYPAAEHYIAYTTRGCVNRCSFCAVPRMEGALHITNNIKYQLETIKDRYGDKRNLLLMDNNILGLNVNELQHIVQDLNDFGFVHEPTFQKPLPLELLIKTYNRFGEDGKNGTKIILDTKLLLNSLLNSRISQANKIKLEALIDTIDNEYDEFMDGVIEHYDELESICLTQHDKRLLHRYVDFNQGMDARELTEEKMQVLAQLPIRPFRIAFDSVKLANKYEAAIRLAHRYGVTHFSNYILYNCDDRPEELYQRLRINIDLANELDVTLYSFPMLYAPIEETDRTHIGNHWNKHFIRNVRSILNVSKGVVAKEVDFFERAYGRNLYEYFKILSMPRDFIVYRNFFDDTGLTQKWYELFMNLNENQKNVLFELAVDKNASTDDPQLLTILKYYRIDFKTLKKYDKLTYDDILDYYSL